MSMLIFLNRYTQGVEETIEALLEINSLTRTSIFHVINKLSLTEEQANRLHKIYDRSKEIKSV